MSVISAAILLAQQNDIIAAPRDRDALSAETAIPLAGLDGLEDSAIATLSSQRIVASTDSGKFYLSETALTRSLAGQNRQLSRITVIFAILALTALGVLLYRLFG